MNLFRIMPRSGIARSYGSSIFSFLSSFHNALLNSCTKLYFHKQCGRAPISPVSTAFTDGNFTWWSFCQDPLQCSCLENPRDGGAWWAAVYGVAQSRTQLKRLSSSSSKPFLSTEKINITVLFNYSHLILNQYEIIYALRIENSLSNELTKISASFME